ncbi:condensation domain-containing protein [Kitasatospora sp. NPDC002227]|uniref:condensation domain-containing protein n=1 Tax=Kitasatospora sp. NPDC002227 TaxID=3154773 RepID=UPI00332820E4
MHPLSSAQRRLWFLDRLGGAGVAYNVPVVLRLRGTLDTEALAAALADLAARHEVLRTVYRERDGEPCQLVLPAAEISIPVVRTSCTAEGLAAAVTAAHEHLFDLATDLPLHAELITPAGAEESVLVLVIHHIATDGWSMGPFMQGLSAAYTARLRGEAPDWEPLAVQYADYALWQLDELGTLDQPGSHLGSQLAFWRETLAGLPADPPLPADRVRPARSSHRGGRLLRVLDPELWEALRERARAADVTPFMLAQAAVGALLARSGAGTDLALGTVVAGRGRPELDELIGFLVNTLVLRTDLSGDPSVPELLERVRGSALAAFAHQELPFDRLVEELAPARTLGRHPLFQVLLLWESGGDPNLELPGVDCRLADIETDLVKFDLEFGFAERPDGGLLMLVGYAGDLFDRATAEALSDRLLRVLTQVAADPGVRVADLELLTAEEEELVSRKWSGGEGVTSAVLAALAVPELAAGPPPGTRLLVLDPYGRPTAPGMPGLLHLLAEGEAEPRPTGALVSWTATGDLLPRRPDGAPAVQPSAAPAAPTADAALADDRHTELVCELFGEVLGVPGIEPEDSFFDLGGHSLLASRLANRLRQALGVQVTVAAVFEHPTPAALARALATGGRRARRALRPANSPSTQPS